MRVQLLCCVVAWIIVGFDIGYPSGHWGLAFTVPSALGCSWFLLDRYRREVKS